jgi:hypothetical protein
VRCYLTRAPDWGRPPRLARNLCPVREAALVTARSRASDYVHRPLRQLPCFSACDAPSGRETQPSESEEAVPSPLSPRAEPVRGGQACLGEQAAGFLLLLSTALLGGECDGRRATEEGAIGCRKPLVATPQRSRWAMDASWRGTGGRGKVATRPSMAADDDEGRFEPFIMCTV